MPRPPLPAPCTEDGCPTLVMGGGPCPKHKRIRRRAYDARRPGARARGYDARWQSTRDAYLAAHPTCECDDPQCHEAATEVHHRDGLGPSGPHGHDWANLRAMTQTCHARVTAQEQPGGWNR
jgi:5-methylcytosine-specific restriction protein A